MKTKLIGLILTVMVAVGAVTGCGSSTNKEGETDQKTDVNVSGNEDTTKDVEVEDDASVDLGEISVISREDGSGTRGAFIELFGIEEKDADGNKVDNTTLEASITNSTSVMMTSVNGDETAIGYISLGSLNETVKAIQVDGQAPSVETIKDGSYKIARPFNIATKGDVSEVTKDFINYILSTQGQAVVEENGYISAAENANDFATSSAKGKIVVAGSSSVSPVMEKLKEAYVVLNPNAEVEIQTNDSSTGMTAAVDGICDIGMASRELKDSELESGLKNTVIALDGIAVIVNNNNGIENITSEDVKSIYIGEIMGWEEISQ